jgi:hypothetical protein
MTRTDKMDRLSRRILGMMIVIGGLLTVFSLSMHVDQGRLKAKFESFIDRAGIGVGGNEATTR